MRPPKGDIGEQSTTGQTVCTVAHDSLDDRVRAISLAMGMVPILWTATPTGGKFDSFGKCCSYSVGAGSC